MPLITDEPPLATRVVPGVPIRDRMEFTILLIDFGKEI